MGLITDIRKSVQNFHNNLLKHGYDGLETFHYECIDDEVFIQGDWGVALTVGFTDVEDLDIEVAVFKTEHDIDSDEFIDDISNGDPKHYKDFNVYKVSVDEICKFIENIVSDEDVITSSSNNRRRLLIG